MLQHMQNHRGDSRLAMAAADDDARLILALLVKVFGIGIHLQSQLLGANQLGVVDAGMHTKDNCVVCVVEFFGIPAPLRRQDAFFGKARLGRLEYLVVRTRDFITLAVQGDGEVVHGTAAYSNKVNLFHDLIFSAKIINLIKRRMLFDSRHGTSGHGTGPSLAVSCLKVSRHKTKKGKLLISHRYNLLPLLHSCPGGFQRELVV